MRGRNSVAGCFEISSGGQFVVREPVEMWNLG